MRSGTIRAALYVRVSTTNRAARGRTPDGDIAYEQNPAVQERPLRQLCEQRGWTVTGVYSDRMSGARDDRPGLTALMQDARRGMFDVCLVWRFDRFSRSIRQMVVALAEFRHLGIEFVSAQEAIDTSTPLGKALFAIVSALAELERDVTRERILAGLEYVRLKGTKSGAAIGRPRAVFDRARAVAMRNAGASWRQISAELGVGMGTVRRAAAAGAPKPCVREAAIDGAITHARA
jgi:DNA invertase Pin-like site-specific DNA recombinase